MQKDNNTFDFHSRLEKIANKAAKEGSCSFPTIWHDFLNVLLHQWNADIKMDLHDATVTMIICAGYCYGDGISIVPTNSSDFWFKLRPTFRFFSLPSTIVNSISFEVTIAIFETINDWCASEYPNPILFNDKNLREKIKNHQVNIDWDSYELSKWY